MSFLIRHFRLKADTVVTAIVYFKGNILCMQENGTIAVLDTNYNRQKTLEEYLNSCKPDDFVALHDSIFIASKHQLYYLDSTLKLKQLARKVTMYEPSLYEDSLYYVYGCCIGEFGGSIFFLSKKTHHTYSYFATCATQVIKFKNQYVVCNNLAHLERSMSYLFVPNPAKLYDLTNDSLLNNCNWYVQVDSLKNYWRKSPVGGVKFYTGTPRCMSLLSFAANDNLYSIISSDGATYIALHKEDSTFERQRMFNNPIQFHQAQVFQAGGKTFCLYLLTGGSPFESYTTRGNSSGIIVISEHRIDMLD